ncbi:hypothetical protein KI387_019380, partial [Taxus chinensis]
ENIQVLEATHDQVFIPQHYLNSTSECLLVAPPDACQFNIPSNNEEDKQLEAFFQPEIESVEDMSCTKVECSCFEISALMLEEVDVHHNKMDKIPLSPMTEEFQCIEMKIIVDHPLVFLSSLKDDQVPIPEEEEINEITSSPIIFMDEMRKHDPFYSPSKQIENGEPCLESFIHNYDNPTSAHPSECKQKEEDDVVDQSLLSLIAFQFPGKHEDKSQMKLVPKSHDLLESGANFTKTI